MSIAQTKSTIDVEHTDGKIVISYPRGEASEPTDAVIVIDKAGLAKYDLEEKPIRKLAETRKLQYRTIGRKRVTTLRWLLECLYSLPAAVAVDPDDDLAAAASKRAARRAGK